METNVINTMLKTMLKGLIVILPLVVIFLIVSLLLNLIADFLQPIAYLISGNNDPALIMQIVSFIILAIILYFVGLFVKTRWGAYFFLKVEKKYLSIIPMYSTVKETIQQFTGQKDMPFTHVVLVDIYGSGTRMTGFVTQVTQNEFFTVFVPTAPNPMNGNIFHVPRDLVTFVDITPDKAMRSIVGLGAGSDKVMEKIKDNPYPEVVESNIFE